MDQGIVNELSDIKARLVLLEPAEGEDARSTAARLTRAEGQIQTLFDQCNLLAAALKVMSANVHALANGGSFPRPKAPGLLLPGANDNPIREPATI